MDFDSVEQLRQQGRFDAALDVLTADARRLRNIDTAAYYSYEAELLCQIGRNLSARQAAAKCLDAKPPKATAARALRVLALCDYNSGDLKSALKQLDTARAECPTRDRFRARLELTRLLLSLKLEPFETTLATLPSVKQFVLKAGDPHLLCELRILIARLEIRRAGFNEARRHHRLAQAILDRHPNVWLKGQMEVDATVGSLLLGDVDGALVAAIGAQQHAAESGDFQTRLASEINLSHVLERKGDFYGAKKHIDHALAVAGDNRHILRAVRDSWANLLITSGDYSHSRQILDEAARQAQADGPSRPHWDAITELQSLARLAQAEGRWSDAGLALDQALNLAETVGDTGWIRRLVNARSRCAALGTGRSEHADESVLADAVDDDPQSVAEYHATVAALQFAVGNEPIAAQHLDRATRIAAAMSNLGLSKDLSVGFPDTTRSRFSPEQSPSLDAAVALLELAGHPHILGREALALLRGSACAEAAALVSTTAAATRIVETLAWSDAQAAAAAAAPRDGLERLTVGRRGEETWTLIVRPKRELEPFCTYAAVRKLLAIALALDGYRREEKQRSALWPADALDGDPEAIWVSEQMHETLGIARRVAPTPISVLITGETGTGKEMLARAIHRASDRADRVFLPFNCTAVPREMLDSQLFGHRKGAFTGADTAFAGVIRAAAGGTLFLDEIAELGPAVQPKLLRFLESREIHPLGEPHPITVDVRIVAATNASIEQMVADGRFREDLFYRLNIVRLTLPPLRERREEIPPLVQLYLRKYGDEYKKGRLTLGDDTLEYLLLFPWPGNVRQLANEVRRMVALADPDATLTPAMLSPEIQASRRTIPATPTLDQEVRVALDQPLPAAVEMLEQLMVRRALDRAHGRVEEASRLLGISRKGLFLKRRRWGLGQAS